MRRLPLLLLAGCAPSAGLELPPGPAKTVALLSEGSKAGGLAGVVLDARDARALVTAPPTLALEYAEDVVALDWRLGELEEDEGGRARLRRPDAAYAREGEAWRPLEATDPTWGRLARFRYVWPEERCGAGPMCVGKDGFCGPCAPDVIPAPPAPPATWTSTACGESSILAETIEVLGDPVRACSAEIARCPDGARATARGACVAVGLPCALDDRGWPNELPPVPFAYVAHDAAPGGDGTRDRPYRLGEALTSTSISGQVVLDAGTHVGALVGPSRVHELFGACADGTTIELSGTLVSSMELRALAVASSTLAITAPLLLDGVLLRDVRLQMWRRITMDGVRYDGGRLEASAGFLDIARSQLRGVELQSVGQHDIVVRDSVIEGSIHTNGATLSLSSVAFRPLERETSVRLSGGHLDVDRAVFLEGSEGIELANGASAVLRDARFSGLTGTALRVDGPRSRLDAERVVADDVGAAIHAADGAQLSLRQLAVRETQRSPIGSTPLENDGTIPHSLGPTLILSDARIDGAGQGDGFDASLSVRGGVLRLERAHILARPGPGRTQLSAGVRLGANDRHDALDATIRDLRVEGTRGAALEIHGSDTHRAQLVLERASLESSLGVGFMVRTGRGSARLHDLDVRGVGLLEGMPTFVDCPYPQLPFCQGTGIMLATGAREFEVVLDRFRVRDVHVGLAWSHAIVLDARAGTISGAAIGVAAHLEHPDWRDVLREVRVDATRLELIADF